MLIYSIDFLSTVKIINNLFIVTLLVVETLLPDGVGVRGGGG